MESGREKNPYTCCQKHRAPACAHLPALTPLSPEHHMHVLTLAFPRPRGHRHSLGPCFSEPPCDPAEGAPARSWRGGAM